MSSQLTEKTEVLKDRVRKVEGYPGRWIIPVVVPNQSMISGPWSKHAAEAYARDELRLVEPGIVASQQGISRPYEAYMRGAVLPHHLGRTSLEEFRQVAAEDAAIKTSAGGEVPDPRWVVELHVDGNP